MNVKEYIYGLIIDAHKWQYTDINGFEDKPRLYFIKAQWAIIIMSILLQYFILKEGLNKDFAGYFITALSIFVGLFLSLVIMVFDKFSNIDFGKAVSQTEKLNAIRSKNFFKQFTSLTSYSIMLAILCLFLLAFSMSNQSVVVDLKAVKNVFENTHNWLCLILEILKLVGVLIYRICIIYFLLDFLYITTYAVGSMYDYMKSEYNKTTINKDEK